MPPGLAARQLAVGVITAVLREGRTLDDAVEATFSGETAGGLSPRDRAFARLMAVTVLRRLGELETVLATFLDKPLPERQGRLWPILLSGAAQLLVLGTPPHAAISLAVEQCRLDKGARRFDRLVNAVLRRVSVEGSPILDRLDGVRLNFPDWLWRRWVTTYGEDLARRLAEASLAEPALDLTAKRDAALWAERLGGILLPTGSIRLGARGRIEELRGFSEGAWWVQDAAASIPARLLGAVEGLEVVDLCAAPGGKTAQLAAAGARVTAVDISPRRLSLLTANLERLGLAAEVVVADATQWFPGRTFPAVLLDAPCTATGTLRRNPDILRLKREKDLPIQLETQRRLLDNATRLVQPGGRLVYCSCSLEPEEGPEQVSALLARAPQLSREPIRAGEAGIPPDWISAEGDLRTLPIHLQLEPPERSGLDGFYAARLRRST